MEYNMKYNMEYNMEYKIESETGSIRIRMIELDNRVMYPRIG